MELVSPPVMALNRHSVINSPASRARNSSLVSKFTDRFGNGNRNISDFHVEPDDPWKTYSPGDVVKGSIVLTITKPTRITHLVVCLHGYAKVFKNAVAPGESPGDSGYLGPGRGRRGGEYLGNGFASLFEDEVVLCGDGRLKEGVYKFRFELCFPPCSLPSSILFERGTISYVITSTLTRPTTISPTLSCDKNVVLLESIDIAPLPSPKPKVISLEPVSKRSKGKTKNKSSRGHRGSLGIARHTPELSQDGSDARTSRSPVPSENSSSSCVTESTQSFQVVSEQGSGRSATVRNEDSTPSVSERRPDPTIMATTKLLRTGALPGDVLPLHISLQHSKPIRSPHGIIITFYRQGRIDMYPAIPIGLPEKGKEPVFEDYYPKSRTGLGGLSFGASRSNCLFRKDLSQSFSPLIIDPNTMTAEVKTSIRIPEDSFPTITRVPGGMISFRYYVEVVMDLGGKLASSQDRFFPRLGMVNSNSKYSPNGRLVNTMDKGRGMVSTDFAGNVVDTDQIRREKSVVSCVFEVIVGSSDSARRTQRQHSHTSLTPDDTQQQQQTSHENGDLDPSQYQQQQHQSEGPPPADYDVPPNDYFDGEGYSEQNQQHSHHPPNYPPGQFIPPVQPEEEVDEKTRLRRAEEVLLPSAPPDCEPGASSSAAPAASAPVFSENDSFHHHPDNRNPNQSDSHDRTPILSPPSLDTLTVDVGDTQNLESSASGPAPGYSSPLQQSTPQSHDKQELERQRLLNEASAPHEDGQQSERDGQNNHDNHISLRNDNEPSAPALTEEDIIRQPPPDEESPPQYQR